MDPDEGGCGGTRAAAQAGAGALRPRALRWPPAPWPRARAACAGAIRRASPFRRAGRSAGSGMRGRGCLACGRRWSAARPPPPAAGPGQLPPAPPAVRGRCRSTVRASASAARVPANESRARVPAGPRAPAWPGPRPTGPPAVRAARASSAAPPAPPSPTRCDAGRRAGSPPSPSGRARRPRMKSTSCAFGPRSPLRLSACPSTATRTSPALSPACSAGPPGLTPTTSTPSSRERPPPTLTPSMEPAGRPWTKRITSPSVPP